MKILNWIHDQIIQYMMPPPPESGGILGQKDGVICAFAFDPGTLASPECAVYIPQIEALNAQIEQWTREGIAFCGMFHSHLPGAETLSADDLIYINTIAAAVPDGILPLYFPIVFPGRKMLAYRTGNQGGDLTVVADPICLIAEDAMAQASRLTENNSGFRV